MTWMLVAQISVLMLVASLCVSIVRAEPRRKNQDKQ